MWTAAGYLSLLSLLTTRRRASMAGFVRGALACGIALAGLAVAQPARATLTLTVSDAAAGGPISACSATDGGTGILIKTCSDANFPFISINAFGSPLLPVPGLNAPPVALTASGGTFPDTLTIEVAQTNLVFPGGDVAVNLAVNAPVGPGPFILEADAPGGTSIFAHTFTMTGTQTSPSITLGPITSDDAIFSLTFTAPNPIPTTASILLTAVPPPPIPEPASLVLLGTALAGLGVFGIRRRRPCCR
jgi:hypothetical protein